MLIGHPNAPRCGAGMLARSPFALERSRALCRQGAEKIPGRGPPGRTSSLRPSSSPGGSPPLGSLPRGPLPRGPSLSRFTVRFPVVLRFRLTPDQLLLSGNPPPLRPSGFAYEYLLLLPRSAARAGPPPCKGRLRSNLGYLPTRFAQDSRVLPRIDHHLSS